jgi:BirA family transcriptional regulator, biotin operon repressor / biotin---[acetyl-CoA-carboxylase] ligase
MSLIAVSAGAERGVTDLLGRYGEPMVDRGPIDADALRAAVEARWSRGRIVAETASTNLDLLDDPDAPDRSVLVAEHQVAGRGRLDRSWSSPPGAGLTFSVLLRPTAPMLQWGWLPLLAGVALHEAVAAAGVGVALKWPNDLLAGAGQNAADYRKAAGILTQTSGEVVVVGIGLNVSTTAEELPVDTATSLALCGGPDLDRTALLVAILNRLDARYAQWTDFGGDAEAAGLAAAYRSACATIGQLVLVTGVGDAVRGRAIGVDATGRLIVEAGGVEHAVAAGDVEHVRPG